MHEQGVDYLKAGIVLVSTIGAFGGATLVFKLIESISNFDRRARMHAQTRQNVSELMDLMFDATMGTIPPEDVEAKLDQIAAANAKEVKSVVSPAPKRDRLS